MTFIPYLFQLLIHWIADFCLQTDEQAKGKASSLKMLTFHVATYTIVSSIMWYFILWDWRKCLIFAGITFVAHFVTDFITSKIGKPFWQKGDFHNGFVLVGFDQILHYVQLYLTYIWLNDLVI